MPPPSSIGPFQAYLHGNILRFSNNPWAFQEIKKVNKEVIFIPYNKADSAA